jgi:hypothetical protein
MSSSPSSSSSSASEERNRQQVHSTRITAKHTAIPESAPDVRSSKPQGIKNFCVKIGGRIEIKGLHSRPGRWSRDPARGKAATLVYCWWAISRRLWGATKHLAREGWHVVGSPKRRCDVRKLPIWVVAKCIVVSAAVDVRHRQVSTRLNFAFNKSLTERPYKHCRRDHVVGCICLTNMWG